jgi:hypothetical protein
VCSPESISHTLYLWTRNTGYEIGPTQDLLNNPAKADGGEYSLLMERIDSMGLKDAVIFHFFVCV